MPMTAKSIVQRATDISQDKTSVRWPADEWVRWLNDGQREIALYRPDAFSTFAPIALVAGTRQALPATAVKLIDIPNNTNGGKGVVRQIERRQLDEQVPGWHSLAGSTDIKHFTYDPRDPRAFYVYPPAQVGASVNAVYAVYPTDIVEPVAGSDFNAVVGNINVADIFGNALLDFMLYRAYLKDSDYAGNGARAQAHYAAFANALGIEVKATVTIAPNAVTPGGPAAAVTA